jgi:radical SAM protein with 4Fe4S-binding SPASM domain
LILLLRDFTFLLTQECNLSCRYCFQKRSSQRLGFTTIKRVLEFFQDAFEPHCFISFYGGEPFLEFETIRRTVDYTHAHDGLRKKRLRFSISTNGSLLTEELLRFMAAHRFRVNLSHDGTAQETTRPSRMNPLILENLDRMIRWKGIELETNSVFIPATVDELFRSARFLVERGVQNCTLSYSLTDDWDRGSLEKLREQLQELSRYILADWGRASSIPIANLRKRTDIGIFSCSAGQDRLALGVDGKVWGCRFFIDFFADRPEHPLADSYCLGDFQRIRHRPWDSYSAVRRHYGILRQESFSSGQKDCRGCPHLLCCSFCPVTAALKTGTIGKAPAWLCEMKRIWREESHEFLEAVGSD